MSLRFLHAADVHLGYQQYGCHERYHDFARAFGHLVDTAIERKVDFVLLAGDLFHKRAIGPQTLLQAIVHLTRLQQAAIPVYAIEGNHDKPLHGANMSWVEFLAESRLLVVLTAEYHAGQIQVLPWDAKRRAGCYVDLPEGIRIIGQSYAGASTRRVITDLTQRLQELGHSRYTILMLHSGLQGVLDNYQAVLTRSDLEVLRPHVDYVALGHIHKPFSQAGWIYNPGSVETNSANEVEWSDRGYLLVDVENGAHQVSTIPSQRRRFIRLALPVDTYPSPDALYEGLAACLSRAATPDVIAQRPVIWLALTGMLAFERSALDIARIENQAMRAFEALVCRVQDNTVSHDTQISTSETMTREQMERYVLVELAARDARRQPQAEQWAEMIQRLKRMSLGGTAPADIVADLESYCASCDLLADDVPPPGGRQQAQKAAPC